MADETLEEFEARRAKEWSKYVAVDRIVIGGALAFNPGDPVPAGHVDRDDAPVSKDQVKAAPKPAATKEG